jgi:hypothetical protein
MKWQRLIVLLVVLLAAFSLAAAVHAQGTISPGETIEGQLNNSTQDYTFSAKAGETLVISLNSDAFDPLIEVYDESGNEVGRDDDSGGFPNARLIFTTAQGGNFTIRVTSFSGAASGPYTLSLNTLTTIPITYGAPVEVQMQGTAPVILTFEGTEGDVLNIFAVSPTGEDTRLALRGPDGAEIAQDDDSGADFNPYLRRVILPSTGTYQLALAPFSDTSLSGAVTVTIEETELLTLDANPQTVALGGDNPESEVFQFEAEAGTTYRIIVSLDPSNTSGATIEIFQGGEDFASTSMSAYGSTSRLTMDFAPASAGPIIIQVSSSPLSDAAADVTVSMETVE